MSYSLPWAIQQSRDIASLIFHITKCEYSRADSEKNHDTCLTLCTNHHFRYCTKLKFSPISDTTEHCNVAWDQCHTTSTVFFFLLVAGIGIFASETRKVSKEQSLSTFYQSHGHAIRKDCVLWSFKWRLASRDIWCLNSEFHSNKVWPIENTQEPAANPPATESHRSTVFVIPSLIDGDSECPFARNNEDLPFFNLCS